MNFAQFQATADEDWTGITYAGGLRIEIVNDMPRSSGLQMFAAKAYGHTWQANDLEYLERALYDFGTDEGLFATPLSNTLALGKLITGAA